METVTSFFNIGNCHFFSVKDTVKIELVKGKSQINVVVVGGYEHRVDLSSVDEAKTEYERVSTLLVNIK